jgi:glycosyltransferase involved in cell wall biosynthesis
VRLYGYPPETHAHLHHTYTPEAMALWMAEDDPLAGRLLEDHRRHPFHLIVCEQVLTANIARALPSVPVLLDEHNIESHTLEAVFRSLPRLQARLNPDQVQAMIASLRDYEQSAWSRSRLISCVTEQDGQEIRSRCATPVRIVPNGADVGELPFLPPSQRTGCEILFVGMFAYPPNIKAAQFLVREVLPLVRNEEPSAKLILCGKNPGLDVGLLRRPGVEVTGTVPSVIPWLQRAAVFSNALFAGSGSSLKVLEALACGIPLVSTAFGVRGFPVTPTVEYTPAENAEEFARAILAVFRNRAAYDAQARSGRRLAERFAWDRVGEEFSAAAATSAASMGVAARPPAATDGRTP